MEFKKHLLFYFGFVVYINKCGAFTKMKSINLFFKKLRNLFFLTVC